MVDVTPFSSVISRDTPIIDALAVMGASERNKFLAGIAVVVDDDRRVIAVVTDGDVRRGLSSGVPVDRPVSAIANFHPMVLKRSLPRRKMRESLLQEAHRRGVHYVMFTRLVLVDDHGRFADVIPLSDILERQTRDKVVAIHGMGYVGLTLAATFAKAGLSVVGIDIDSSRIAQLREAQAPFYEKGLDSLLSALAGSNPIRYTTDPFSHASDVHIVTVGSPVGDDKRPRLEAVEQVSRTIAGMLKSDDLVVFRSTLPVGTIRATVKPILETSGLLAGRDFHLAFAPERTVEGNALEELRTLPQIIGGFDKESADAAAKLFSHITNSIVEVDSLEAAELIKLANNTFRDLVFSFANELASVCERYNINAFRLVQAANEGYPRDQIPMPSPGVGGLCLSKDPFLYSHPVGNNAPPPVLGRISRRINGSGHEGVLSKLASFARRSGRECADLRILIVGLAFKGQPETSDFRDSVSLKLLESLPNRANVMVKDFVVGDAEIAALGCRPAGDLAASIADVDAVLFMNNHHLNNRFNAVQALKASCHPIFFFDGWNLFDQHELESLSHVTYATMGYETRLQ